MKNMTRHTLICMVLTILFSGILFFMAPLSVDAKQELVVVEGAVFNVNSSLVENLRTFLGKKVYLTLDSGKVFSGNVKEVGDHLVHLEKLDGKEYFDALIPIDGISAVDARFRQPAPK